MVEIMKIKRFGVWAIFWAMAGMLYFFLPMYGTLDFSLRMQKVCSAYRRIKLYWPIHNF